MSVWEKLQSHKQLIFSVSYLGKKEMLWLVFFEFSYTSPNIAEKILKMLAIKLKKFLNIHILPLSEILKPKAVEELVKLKRQSNTEHYGS